MTHQAWTCYTFDIPFSLFLLSFHVIVWRTSEEMRKKLLYKMTVKQLRT